MTSASAPAGGSAQDSDQQPAVADHILHLLHAENLPASTRQIRCDMTDGAISALEEARQIIADTPGDEARGRVSSALAMLGDGLLSIAGPPLLELPPDRYTEHDSFFGVLRVDGNAADIFARSLLEAHRVFLLDAESEGSSANGEFGAIAEAFHALYEFLRAAATPSAGQPPARIQGIPAPSQVKPLARWRIGHQIFFAMIQGLVVIMNCVTDDLEQEKLLASSSIACAGSVMRGSAAAMRFAGGFSARSYAQIVRPAMMPPHLEDNFSGLQSRDHRYLLVLLMRVNRLMQAAAADEAAAYRRFLDEVDAAYEAHKYVCARFGGDTIPSLRMSANSGSSSVEVLEKLRIARLRQLGGAIPPT